jgi:glycine/serine hydroxymethyltransferase
VTLSTGSRTAWSSIAEVDPELWTAMVGERERQRWKIELIASENYAFAAGARGTGLVAH